MIVGVGTDLVDIRRIERMFSLYPERFERRIFTDKEQALVRERSDVSGHKARMARYAKYFAAKEAAYKALGVGRGSGIGWHDFEVGYHETGQPRLRLSLGAQRVVGNAASVHLSLSDEYPYAQAFVVISAS